MVAAQGARQRAHELDHGAEPAGRRERRVVGGHLGADHRPPGLGHGRVLPLRRVRVAAGVGRDDERPLRPDGVAQRLDDRLRAAADPAERRDRRVHQQHAAGPHAERAQVAGQPVTRDRPARAGARLDAPLLAAHPGRGVW